MSIWYLAKLSTQPLVVSKNACVQACGDKYKIC